MADNNKNKVLNVPHLRFPEFTGEWQCKAIEKVAPLQRGFDLPTQNLVEGIYPVIYSNGILQHHDKYKCEAPGLITGRSGTIGKFTYIDSGFYWPHNTSLWVTDFCGNCPKFIYYLYQTVHIEQFSTGSGVPTLNRNDVHRYKTSIPTAIVEQEKIAKFLSILDERIVTQNKIIEDLKKLKSAIVEMLLCNQNGESFKLRDVGCFVRGLTYANEDVTENKAATTVIRANNLNYGNNVDKDEVVYVNKTPTASQILRKGDIVICMANGSSSLVGKNSYYPFNDGQSTIGAFCGIYRTSYPFVKWLMQSQRYKRLVYQSLQGGNGAIANLNGDDILNMSFPLIEKEKSQSIIFAIDAIEKSLMVNKSLQRLYYTQKSYLLKQMFI